MGMLSYRALKWMSTVGVAPRWADALLLVLVAALVFVGLSTLILSLISEGALILLPISLLAWAGVFGIWYWSNHFKHKVAVSVHEAAEAEVMPAAAAPLKVLPIEDVQAPAEDVPGMT